MTTAPSPPLTLEEFLALPSLEASPAWEYVHGVAVQKPMPKTRHSLLQKKLLIALDSATEDYTAFPELRCTFGGRSLVPDLVVVSWAKLDLNETGEPQDQFTQAPDWSIEILSPDQNANRVIDNLLHCLQNGTQLGWLIDPDDYSVLVLLPQQPPQLYRGNDPLPMLTAFPDSLTATQLFAWLQVKRK
ncbi:MAG: Uma2 family endonuclease [Kamptonema sp. SIO4C4]|nr:Uma2 family endonuclease [Kamptonema sp. SIO4C4]